MAYDIVSLIPIFCAAFLGQSQFEEGDIAFKEVLGQHIYDYSIKSLHNLDIYLDILHKNKSVIKDQTYTNTVLASGCYLGETIRKNSKHKYIWQNYNEYFPKHTKLMGIIKNNLGASAVLVSENGKMTMPINKIIRYIGEGSENNTHFYASAELKNE